LNSAPGAAPRVARLAASPAAADALATAPDRVIRGTLCVNSSTRRIYSKFDSTRSNVAR